MKLDLFRPCPHCPFRIDIPGYLRGARAQEIAESIAGGWLLACHQTTEPDEEGDDMVETTASKACAGMLIMMEKMELPNQAVRIAERIGSYEMNKLDMSAPVADSYDAFITHHASDEEMSECCHIVGPDCEAPAGMMIHGAVIRSVTGGPVDPCLECGEMVCGSCSEDGLCDYCREWGTDD